MWDEEKERTPSPFLKFLSNAFQVFFFVEIGGDVVCPAFTQGV
jgi:hypothetical protein